MINIVRTFVAKTMRPPRIAMVVASGLGLFATTVQAQGRAVDSSGYIKAEALVNNGDAAEGRAMVDSLFGLAKPGTPQYAEGLYWRAKLSSSAEKAQKDYVRLIIEYSESSRVPDALLNVGQLELVRGDRAKALGRFERLRKDYPGHVLQASASYWAARTLIESNDLPRGCVVNAEALAQVKPGNIELQNRIQFQNQRCRGVQVASVNDSAKPIDLSEATAAAAEAAKEQLEAEATVTRGAKTAAKTTSKTVGKAGAKTTAAAGKTTATAPEPAPAETPTTAAASGTRYAVQIAAYTTKAQALALVESLKEKGYTARVDGTRAPFRVKIGRYVSRTGAEALLAELRARKIDGFITKG